MTESFRSYLRSSPPPDRLTFAVVALIAVGSLVPFADFVAAPALIYMGLAIKAEPGLDRRTRITGQVAMAMGTVMGVLALWSLMTLGELFLPQNI